MNEVANIIETALASLNLNVDRLMHMKINGRDETDPYIVYNKVTDSIAERSDDTDTAVLFLIDVDIYTTDPTTIDSTRENVEIALKQAGFMQLPSGATIVENETEPIWYHEPLSFNYKKELI